VRIKAWKSDVTPSLHKMPVRNANSNGRKSDSYSC